MVESRDIRLEVLCKDFLGDVREPLRELCRHAYRFSRMRGGGITVKVLVSACRPKLKLTRTRNVESSLNVPSLKTFTHARECHFSRRVGKIKIRTSRNSLPSESSSVACSECGMPGGKYQRSPALYVRGSIWIRMR